MRKYAFNTIRSGLRALDLYHLPVGLVYAAAPTPTDARRVINV
jgi:hypothetical protein